MGRPSCSAFLMAMVGCMMQTSVKPATPPMAVCSRGVTELMAGSEELCASMKHGDAG